MRVYSGWFAVCLLILPASTYVQNVSSATVWPKPLFQNVENTFLVLRPSAFSFKVEKYDCDIVQEAVIRYYHLIFSNKDIVYDHSYVSKSRQQNKTLVGFLDEIQIHLLSPCEKYPHERMDEQYHLKINVESFKNTGILIAQSVWGLLRGLETLSQIIVPINGYKYAVQSTSIVDFPKFPFRGLLIDTSRHYLPMKTILRIIDAMAYSKLNVLHWHIVDDQSFPFQSSSFPALSDKGSYDPYYAIYTHLDIKRIIEHARLRGIRVIPEFDTPGHTLSWGRGLPGFLTKCGNIEAKYGPVDPTREENYKIMETLLQEIYNLFPDNYVHLGGDEVDFTCWESNDNITAFMKYLNISGDYRKLEGVYIERLLQIAVKLNTSTIVWQEVFDNLVPVRANTIVHVWKGNYDYELYDVTLQGHQALLSSCWYLDHLQGGGDWEKFYNCNPLGFSGSDEQKRLVLGGESCMWGEVVDETNVQQRIWPRACAAAEVLWYGRASDAPSRLEEHVCRLKKRGIPAQPANGPGYCPYVVL